MSDPIEYLDFEINIVKTEEGSYVVKAAALGGRAEVRFADPFPPDKRALIRSTLTMAALRSSARVRSASTAESKTMKELGNTLFEQTFRDQVREYYYQCLGQARNQGKGVRLRLALDPALGDLPWEFLSTAQKEFIGLDPFTPIVRYIELPTPATTIKVELPLRVLVVVASPSDQVPLDTEAEKRRIVAALAPLEQQGQVQVSYIDGPDTWPRLIDALRPNETHILHYIGHGAYDDVHGEGVLLMEGEDGRTKLVGSDEMRILMQGRTKLRLAILNSCLGTQAGEAEPLASVAAGMVRAGVPAVIAMQFEVSDRAAQIIAGTFYKSLALNFPVDAAVTEARREIALVEKDSLEWATPVLYMQVPNGQLFDISRKAAPPAEPAGAVSTTQMNNVLEMMYRRAEHLYQTGHRTEALKLYQSLAVQDANYQNVAQRIAELSGGAAPTPTAGGPAGATPPSPEAGAPALDLNARAAERYQEAEAAATRGDWEAAVTSYRGALLLVPNFKDAANKLANCERRSQCVKLYAQAQEQYAGKHYSQTLETLAQVRSIDPRWVDSAGLQGLSECGVMYQQALDFLRLGDRTRGAELLRAIIARRADFEDVVGRLDNLAAGGDGLFGEAARPPAPTPGQSLQPLQPPAGSQPTYPQQPGQPYPQQPGQPPAQTPPAQDMRVYEAQGVDMRQLAEDIRQYFFREGYETQALAQGGTIIVQGKKGGWRSLVGMGQAATVILEPTQTGYKASVGGGKWLEQGAAIAVSMVVLWPLLITGGIGMAQQKSLMDTLWRMVDSYALGRGGRRVS